MYWGGGLRVLGGLSVTVLGAVVLAACGTGQPSSVSGGTSATVTLVPTADERVREAADALEDVLDSVEADHGGVAGVSVATNDGVVHVGVDGDSNAWSTIKVPVAIAAAQQGVGSEDLIRVAISESGNAEAAQLWVELGGGEEAATVVDDLLWRNNGVADTRRTVDQYPEGPTPIGLVPWTLNGQAGFASRLACIPEVATVWEAMGDIVPWQRDGLGRIEGMHFKGGWSQEEDGPYSYTYRQFGALPTKDGLLGVAIIAHPEDGTHDAAAAMLDDLADGIRRIIDDGVLVASDECVVPESLLETDEPVDLS